MKRRRKYRRNAISSDDILHLMFAGVCGVALGFIMARKSDGGATSGLRGLGAYFHDPVNIPFSGLGSNYVRTR